MSQDDRSCRQISLGVLPQPCLGFCAIQGPRAGEPHEVHQIIFRPWHFLQNWYVICTLFANPYQPGSLGVYSLEPPTHVCIDSWCSQQLQTDANIHRDHELVEPMTYPITVFTKEFGAVPGYSTSRYCRSMFKISPPEMYVLLMVPLQNAILTFT